MSRIRPKAMFYFINKLLRKNISYGTIILSYGTVIFLFIRY